MFVSISHLAVPAEDHAELERHFRERARLVDDFPAFVDLQLLRPQAGDATHTFLAAWKRRDAFRRYMSSAEHATSHSREPAEIMGRRRGPQARAAGAGRTRVRHEAFDVLLRAHGLALRSRLGRMDALTASGRVAMRLVRDEDVKLTVREAPDGETPDGETPDGETALVEMRRQPPDVVVLDLMMPVLDGSGVLAAMRADPQLAGVPVVLTAKNLTAAERQFLSRTTVRVLQKGAHRLADVAALVLRAATGSRTGAPAS